jgi:transposase
VALYEERLSGDKYRYSGLVVYEEIQKMVVVVVLCTGKWVKKYRTEGYQSFFIHELMHK